MWTVMVPPSGDPDYNDGHPEPYPTREIAVRKARLYAEIDRGAKYAVLDPNGVPDGYFEWEYGKVEYHSLPRR